MVKPFKKYTKLGTRETNGVFLISKEKHSNGLKIENEHFII